MKLLDMDDSYPEFRYGNHVGFGLFLGFISLPVFERAFPENKSPQLI